MNQESLKANDDENTEPTRESGIFADLAVRKAAEPPRAEGRSIPPPPPRTRSSILPVARPAEEEPSLEMPEFTAAEPEHEEEPDFEEDDDDAIRPVQVEAPSTLIRPEAAASTGRTLPPPPPRSSAPPTLPGTSFPSAQPTARSGSIAPGTRPVSQMVANAAVTLPSAPPAMPARDTSGTFQKVDAARTSFAQAMQGPMSVPAAQVALDHADAPMYAPAPSAPAAPSQAPYALLIVGALIAACFAWYMFDTKAVPGVVQLTTAPSDAVVLFDGAPVGSVSPFLKTGVVPGEKHTLEVKKAGFRTWAQEVEVQPGQTLVFTVALPSEAGEQAPSVAPVAAAPAAAAPAPVAAAEPAAPAPVAASPVAAEPAAVAAEEEPKAQPAPAARRRVSRPAASAAASGATGTLRVSSKPWSVVTVDGKLIGNTPQMNLTLSEGSHRVQLMNPEFKIEKVMTVKIEAGKTETLIVNLL